VFAKLVLPATNGQGEQMPKKQPPTLEERVAQQDRQLTAIRQLMLKGMRMMCDLRVDLTRAHAEHNRQMKDLRGAQKNTDQSLERLIRSLERGTKRKIS
jgi:hypothetical protein